MSDGILTRPLQQNDELFEQPVRTIPMAGGVWVQVLDTQPSRVHARVAVTELGDSVILSPDSFTVPGPGVVGTGVTLMTLHVAADLLFIGGAWWAYSGGAATAYVWEVRRQRGA